ncbi:hypothetical protein Tco_1513883, partial [Tanacetum coccineum]
VATVMVLTIVISSDDYSSEILYKFVMLVTIMPIFFGELNAHEGLVTQIYVMEADNAERLIDESDNTRSISVVESASGQQKKRCCCLH